MAGTVTIRNTRIYVEGRFIHGSLRIRAGRIAEFGGILPGADDEIMDAGGRMLVPGFIDIHTHGAASVDVNHADAEGFERISRFFASRGTTGWLCSVLSDTREKTLECIATAREAMRSSSGAQLLGVHLEGPFLSSEYAGAMPKALLRQGETPLFREYQEAAQGAIRYLTVAPEVPGVPELIREIASETAIGLGHSGATYDQAMECIEAGAKAVTHTFNAMRLFHQHEPGIMGAALESDLYCEAICDGIHLHPASVRLLLKAKGYERVVAVTDSIMAAGMPDGDYVLGANEIVVSGGDAKLKNGGARAGSTLTTDAVLRNLVRFTGQPAERVLPLLTENPAKLIGESKNRGVIRAGLCADLVLLNEDLTVCVTWVQGRRVYTNREGDN